MTHTYYHAKSSAHLFGGIPEDYLAIHDWFDATKESFCDFRHRALRHHAEGIFECERIFGTTVTNSAGNKVPVRYVGEQHVMEDCGRIPSVADWLSTLQPQPWMARATKVGAHSRRAES
ncbi:MAG: hypothetical protein KDN22_24060 [Verrucomicrobiae bacterium]|nr:hypothetical protein [Verrucomicrobiae bacterium]